MNSEKTKTLLVDADKRNETVNKLQDEGFRVVEEHEIDEPGKVKQVWLRAKNMGVVSTAPGRAFID